jgi:hypothetical protein
MERDLGSGDWAPRLSLSATNQRSADVTRGRRSAAGEHRPMSVAGDLDAYHSQVRHLAAILVLLVLVAGPPASAAAATSAVPSRRRIAQEALGAPVAALPTGSITSS